MGLCNKCGSPLLAGAKFCNRCGSGITSNSRAEYFGKLRKCPACGQSVNGFSAKCPLCGTEFYMTNEGSTIAAFVGQIKMYETDKINWMGPKSNYNCVPVKLSAVDNAMVAYIENYMFPNERTVIIEALTYINNKLSFMASDTIITSEEQFWTNVWYTKATNIYNNAKYLLGEDEIVFGIYNDIRHQYETNYSMHNQFTNPEKQKKIKSGITKFAIVGGGVVSVLFFIIIISIELFRNHPINWPEYGISQQIPHPEEKAEGKILENTDDFLRFYVKDASEDEFIIYSSLCATSGFVNKICQEAFAFGAFRGDDESISVIYDENYNRYYVNYFAIKETKMLKWMQNDLCALLPPISDKYGWISKNTTGTYVVNYINITNTEFMNYIGQCKTETELSFRETDPNVYKYTSYSLKTDISIIWDNTNVMRIEISSK